MYIVYRMNRQGVGVEFVGPFDSEAAAERYGVHHWQDEDGVTWEVVGLTSPC